MSTKQISILLGVFIVLGLIVFAVRSGVSTMDSSGVPVIPEGVACTMEAKMCPDGSYVGRIGSKCEFAACPAFSTPPAPVTDSYTTSIGQMIGGGFLTIAPFQVIEDSRCPIDVQCIQQGTVRVKAHVSINGTTTDQIFILGKAQVLASSTVALVKVLPVPSSKVTIATSSYRFTFEITH